MVDATTMTEVGKYAQAAVQKQAEVEKGKEKGDGKEKEKGTNPTAVTPEGLGGLEVSAHLPQRFPFVEDLSEYEEEGEGG